MLKLDSFVLSFLLLIVLHLEAVYSVEKSLEAEGNLC